MEHYEIRLFRHVRTIFGLHKRVVFGVHKRAAKIVIRVHKRGDFSDCSKRLRVVNGTVRAREANTDYGGCSGQLI